MIFKRWRSQGGGHDLVWRAVKRFFFKGDKFFATKVGEVYWVIRGLHWKIKNIFFVIRRFFLTQVDKLLNAPRTWHHSHKRKIAPDQDVTFRQLQRMRQNRHSQPPLNRIWRGKSNVGTNKNNHCKKVAHDSSAHPWWMAAAPSLPPMAHTTPPWGTVGAITVCDIPDTPSPKPDTTWLDGYFLRRSKWKLYQLPNRHNRVANFLTAVDWPNEETGVWKHCCMPCGMSVLRSPTRLDFNP